MNALELRKQIEITGCELSARGSNLVVTNPKRLPPELVAQLRERKAELLVLLAPQADLLAVAQRSLFGSPATAAARTASSGSSCAVLPPTTREGLVALMSWLGDESNFEVWLTQQGLCAATQLGHHERAHPACGEWCGEWPHDSPQVSRYENDPLRGVAGSVLPHCARESYQPGTAV